MPKSSRDVRAQLRDYAMSLPEATADFPWGERVAKVSKKVFVFLGRDMDEKLAFGVKLKASHASALTLSSAKPMAYGLGKSGWVSFSFEDEAPPRLEQLEAWIQESYALVAPKTLAAQLGVAKLAKNEPAKANTKKAKAAKASAKKTPAKKAAAKKAPAKSKSKRASAS